MISGAAEEYVRAEINRRLTKLENELRLKATSNPNAGDTGDISSLVAINERSDVNIPGVSPPTNPSVVPQIGTITIRWGASPTPRLIPYEIQFSTDLSFSSVVTKYTSDLEYTWPEGNPTGNYYARVRARTQDGGISEWSEPLETSTGKAGWQDLTALAATNPVRTVDDRETSGAGSGTTILGGGSADFGNTWITTTGGIVTAQATVQASYQGNTNDYFTMDMYRDTTIVSPSGQIQFPSDVTALARSFFPGLGLPSAPVAGTYEYFVRVSAGEGIGGITPTAVTVVVHKVEMVLTEFRQGIQ